MNGAGIPTEQTMSINLIGTKIVEIPYFASHLGEISNSILLVGERDGEEGIGKTVHEMGYTDVITTDMSISKDDSWLKQNTNWKHIVSDFVEFDESKTYDRIVAVSVFEHFGFWFDGAHMANGLAVPDMCRWNHDLAGINKACRLLKNSDSKLIITLPAGPYLNYEDSGKPWLRSYDARRQAIVKAELNKNGYVIDNATFFHSSDFYNWKEVGHEINDPRNYGAYCVTSPNVIWGFTVSRIV